MIGHKGKQSAHKEAQRKKIEFDNFLDSLLMPKPFRVKQIMYQSRIN